MGENDNTDVKRLIVHEADGVFSSSTSFPESYSSLASISCRPAPTSWKTFPAASSPFCCNRKTARSDDPSNGVVLNGRLDPLGCSSCREAIGLG